MHKKILIIEDDLFIAQLYEHVLKSAGFQVELALDGRKGLELCLSKPDLILLDIMLPKLNGIDLLREVKKNPSICDIPVFLLSNLAQSDIIDEGLRLGAKGYILKVDMLPKELVIYVTDYFSKMQTTPTSTPPIPPANPTSTST